MFSFQIGPPVWVQRHFKLTVVGQTWNIQFNRDDVNDVLDHLEASDTEAEFREIASDMGLFLLEQMMAFRHAQDVIALQEMSDECWGKDSPQ